ncbi:transcriptional regulator, MerR family [Aeromicrobium marinum DSM 15272]|uniref:Transcriptional regulator, MerR family n=1 Tax=Aeromicrobium marinum DSM 15272 TaxID=585531 RepID=E2SCF4_9ACTN|nr:MerR family transcriptional regulator [Aeromicrobium marinum]EFQ82907.1 transcriptional regulator, MerR family [Aeromicrobium marinum DSM 15272]
MKVSELSRRTGVSIHRLRRWEAAGLVQAHRDGRGVRHFDDAAVRVVTFVAMARDLGFGLDRIGRIAPGYAAGRVSIDEYVGHLQTRLTEIDAQIAELQEQRRRVVDHVAWFDARRPHPLEESP